MKCHISMYNNFRGQIVFSFIILLSLLIGAIGVGVYFYFTKEKIMQLHLEKVDILNKKIVTLSEYVKNKEIENKELNNLLEEYKKEMDEYKKNAEFRKEIAGQITDIKGILDQQFLKVTDSLSLGFGKVDNLTMLFDAKIGDYFNKNKDEIVKLIAENKISRSQNIDSPGVELPTVVVTSKNSEKEVAVSTESVQATPQPLPAENKNKRQIKILKVNQEHNFFVIDKGMIDGMKVGMNVAIFRKDIKIGNGLVSEVRELVSLARIEQQFDGHFVEEGDTVNIE